VLHSCFLHVRVPNYDVVDHIQKVTVSSVSSNALLLHYEVCVHVVVLLNQAGVNIGISVQV
jgi:hypothetical protein